MAVTVNSNIIVHTIALEGEWCAEAEGGLWQSYLFPEAGVSPEAAHVLLSVRVRTVNSCNTKTRNRSVSEIPE